MMNTSTLWTWCAPLVLVFAVSTTGCDKQQNDQNRQEQASAEQPADKQGAALKPTEATEDENTEVINAKEYAPEILDLSFEPSKFVKCGQSLKICAKARDRNGDTLQFNWKKQAGKEMIESFSVAESTQTGNNAEECVRLTPNQGFNQIQLIVSEDAQGGRADSISFPLHVGDGNC